MRVRWVPLHPGAVAFSGGVCLSRTGGDAGNGAYDLPPGEVERLNLSTPGIDGNPCLIPCESPGHEAARDFIAAVSAPTAFNPEAPPAAVSEPSPEPVRRTRGRRSSG